MPAKSNGRRVGQWLARTAPAVGRLLLTLFAVVWAFAWYAPAWLTAQAWANLRRGWADGTRPPNPEN